LGTTFSKVAVLDGDQVVLIEDTASKSATRAAVPSSIACLNDGTILVGEPVREYLATDPARVVSSVKRVIGLRYSDPLANGLLGSLACTSYSGPNDAIIFDIQGRQITVVEVTSIILSHLLKMASDWAGTKVTKAVLTYPVDFDRAAKRELELAAKMAGIEVLAFVPEPVAAVMGCGFDSRDDNTIAVYDFGGGTFDASIVKVGNERFSVLGSAGDRWLGGDDLDELLARNVADEYNRLTHINLHNKKVEFQRLLFACEESKRWLSTLESVDVILPRAALTPQGHKTLLVPITRSHFEQLAEDVITSSLEVCRQAAEGAGMMPEDVDSLLLTGGTTRIPAVRAGAQRYFSHRGVAGVHPEHAVVIGAAVRAAILAGLDIPANIGDWLKGQATEGRDVGLSLADGTSEPIITSSDQPPVTAHRHFATSIDGQTACRIELVRGNSPRTAENHLLGSFIIDGLPPRRAGETNIDIYFDLSSTGTLYVTAQDRATGQRAQGTFDLADEGVRVS
jgi:molecular chaperone DnaK